MRFLPFLLLVSTLSVSAQAPIQPESIPYQWQSVPIRGGGFVPGIIFHPTEQGVRYCRTDMGGAYRWDDQQKAWQPLLDWLSYADSNLQGVESIAIDPNDARHVIMACGTYTQQAASMLVSHDGGQTFSRTEVTFGTGGNENGRGNGERLMISPTNSRIAYMGTRLEGLWRTIDDGQTWQRVQNFPADNAISVLFEGENILVASSVKGANSLWCSQDQGESWSPIAGQPTQWMPTHMVLSSDRKLYVSYGDSPGPSEMHDGAVFAYDLTSGQWTDITPYKPKGQAALGFGYAAIAVDAQNPKQLIASTHGLWGKYGFGDDELFCSRDGGRHWVPIFLHGHRYDCTLAPYTAMSPLHWMFDIEIDPFDSEHAMITTGFGGWETFNLSAAYQKRGVVVWSLLSNGIEETVPLEFYCPPTGARLMVGIGDYGGFTFDDIEQVAPDSNNYPHFANTDGVTGAWQRPEIAVRVGEVFHGTPDQLPISWSVDGGHQWEMVPTVPQPRAHHGHIAVAADASSWIWTPERMPAYRTTDHGQSWTLCQGLPQHGIRTIADRQNSQRYYAVDVVNRHLYSSEDGGQNFRCDSLLLSGVKPMRRGWGAPMMQQRGDYRGGQDRVYATPGHEGDLWIPAYDGLYHLQLDAATSAEIRLLQPEPQSHVRTIYAFGFGKGLTPDYPTLYLIGVVDGQYGFFRSTDQATTWQKINDDAHQYGHVLHIIGDMQEFGRVYIGTHGRGVITGAPIK